MYFVNTLHWLLTNYYIYLLATVAENANKLSSEWQYERKKKRYKIKTLIIKSTSSIYYTIITNTMITSTYFLNSAKNPGQFVIRVSLSRKKEKIYKI